MLLVVTLTTSKQELSKNKFLIDNATQQNTIMYNSNIKFITFSCASRLAIRSLRVLREPIAKPNIGNIIPKQNQERRINNRQTLWYV